MLTFEEYISDRYVESLPVGSLFVTTTKEVLYRVDKKDTNRNRVLCSIIFQNPGTNPVSAWPFGQRVTKVFIKEIKVKEIL